MPERPPALSAEALAALISYRDATPMPEAARERVQARLSNPAPARPAWLWVGAGAIAAGLVLWGAFGLSDAVRASADASTEGSQAPMQVPQDSGETAAIIPDPDPDPAAARAERPEPRDQAPAPPPAQLPPTPPEDLEAAKLSAPPDPAAAPRARTPSRRQAGPASSEATPTPAPLAPSRLGAENRLIARSWEQVRAKQYAKARGTLAEHASEFPSGVLAPERRALLVIVACLQHPESAAGKADAYAATGRSTLLSKVRSACSEEKVATE